MSRPRIEWMPLSQLLKLGLDNNPKAHDLPATMDAIRRFGFLDWPQIDETSGKLCVGHGRVEALAKMRDNFESPPKNIDVGDGGEWLVPVTRGNELLNDAERDAYVIAHNQLPMAGGWKFEALGDQLRRLTAAVGDDASARAAATSGLGFNRGELDALIGRFADGGFSSLTTAFGGGGRDLEPWDGPGADGRPARGDGAGRDRDGDNDEDEADRDIDRGGPGPAPRGDVADGQLPSGLPSRAITKPGTVWRLGDHRLVCGDMLVPEVVAAALDGREPAMLWTQPPDDEAVENARRKKRSPTVQPGIVGFMAALARACQAGVPAYAMTMPEDLELLAAAAKEAGWSWSSTIVWAQQSMVPRRRDYGAQYQPMWYGWRAGAPRLCAPTDRTLSDLWHFDRPSKVALFPRIVPVTLVVRCINNSSRPGSLVFDPFAGTGPALIGAEQTGRVCASIEIDPVMCDVIVERWQSLTGRKAAKA